MNNNLKYKGFEGSIEYSAEDGVMHGRILNIKGLYASYEGDTLENLYKDFMEAVEFHLLPDEDEASTQNKNLTHVK
jgi:predicted HicB family RNase H-like nuclease